MKTTATMRMKKRTLMTMLAMFAAGSATAQVYSTGGASAEGYKSTIGNLNTASGNYSLAAGSGCQSLGQSSIAMGFSSKAGGLCSMALGMSVESQADYSITIGRGGGLAEPLLNTTGGIMMGMGSSHPTLYISPQYGTGRTGRVGIGNVTDPQAKLHIKGDWDEDASILLEPHNEKAASVVFRETGCDISVNKDNIMHFNTPAYLLFDAPEVCFGSTTTFLSNTNNEVFSIKAPNAIAQEAGTISLTAERDIRLSGAGGIGLGSESITLTGKVGVNTANTTSDYALAVDGGIITTKVFIQDVEEWPDFVFGEGYKLMSLNDLKKYIGAHRHLPDMPSESEVEQNGYDMGEMQRAMLKKIEELTLYTLQQQEEIEALRRMVDELKGK